MRTHSLIISLALAATPALAAEELGFVGGQLSLYDGGKRLSVVEAEEEVGGETIELELRRGELTYEAALRDDGSFVLEAPPGTYRLEYLRVGDRAEFLQPQELKIEQGTLTCAGTIAVRTGPIENLGTNQDSTTEVSDTCGALLPKLQKQAKGAAKTRTELARTGPLIEHPEEVDWMDRVGNLRVELGGYAVLAARVSYLHRFQLHFDPYLAANLYLSAGQLIDETHLRQLSSAFGKEVLFGAGLYLFGFDAIGYGGGRLYGVPLGPMPVLGAMARMNLGAFGVGMRLELMPYPEVGWFIDLSPLALLGGLL